MSNDYDKEFPTRLQEAIEADSTISVYGPSVIAIKNENLDDDDMNAFLDRCMFVIHSPKHDRDDEAGGNGRVDIVMIASITAVCRGARGIDNNKREVGVYGDGVATHPTPIEMQSDIEAMLMNSGAMYLLPNSAGTNYLWDLKIEGTTEPDTLDDTDEITFVTRQVVGHKWEYTWT